MTLISPIAGHVSTARLRWRKDDHVISSTKTETPPFETRRGGQLDRRRRDLPVAQDRRGRRQSVTTPRPMEAKFVAQVIAQAYGLNHPSPSAARDYGRKSEELTQHVTVV
jgi:hypothetical protein